MSETEFSASLVKGEARRTWEIRYFPALDIHVFRTTGPGTSGMGGLSTTQAIAEKRQEFEAEIEAAKADGWMTPK